jgi:predicted outer membrane protein
MTIMISRAAAAAFASLIFASAAFAQSTTTTPAPAATPAPAKTTKARSPESIECSKQADEKGLKGKERKKFRKECIKEAKGTSTGTATKQ